MKHFNIVIFTLLFFLLTSCGFKVLDTNQLKNYKVVEIKETGDKKTNFFLKNRLYNLLNNNDSTDKLIIKVETKKVKTVKEKNKQNRITKYNIKINSLIELYFVNKNYKKTINTNKNGVYDVSLNHNDTKNNEKNIEKNLIDALSKDITNQILKIINEF
tara:strand:- start:1651 stop:2127 length:477 start_codon:yes stop_codon:yes gene_type:complete